ncbi:hypothetical protein DPMN_146375 [Dreissena polymorpha]|uniref:Uncharacterized protein n=1 Tax=Dreissena polymorpha TaxID=45954 RepID=A0A9D4IYC9_DREPO|nr:hypothetical protein DPMN_146375 [Dreissena polymorpha]
MSLLSKNPAMAISIIPDKPVRAAEANLRRRFTHMHLDPLFQVEAKTLAVFLTELLIPDKVNVFYAMNNNGDYTFVLRTRKEQETLTQNKKKGRRKLKLGL